MGRGGLKNKINKRIAHIKWLLYTNKTPPPWATAQKLTTELDFLRENLQQRQQKPATHSANIKIINEKIIKKPPSPKPLPKRKDVCPNDCPGPLYDAACKSTCLTRRPVRRPAPVPPEPIGPGHQQQ